MTPLSELVRIDDPAFYLDPYRVYDRMRVECPVYFYEPLDIFVLTRYKDMRAAAREPEVFTSSQGEILTQLMYPPSEDGGTVVDQFVDPESEFFAFTDPPRHQQLRKVLTAAFSKRAIEALSERIRRCCQDLVAGLPADETIDFIEEIAAPLPILTATHLLGVDTRYTDDIRRWSDALENVSSGAKTVEELTDAAKQFSELHDFLREQIAFKRERPGDDLLSALLVEELDGSPLSETRMLTYCQAVLAVGSDTTRSLLSGLAVALSKFPDQRQRLVADRDLMPTAIEEGLRWTTPGRGFVRTAVSDTVIGSQAIRAGQHIYLLFHAGNFDPEVFENPFDFDVARVQDLQQLALGSGPHTCIAAHLVRVETALLFNELLDRFPEFELDGAPLSTFHVLRNGWQHVPMKFHPTPT